MFFSDMERKTLAITPPSFFNLGGGGGFGLTSKKAFHCLLLLSCLLLSSVNTLHNLAEFESINGYKGIQSFNGGVSGSNQNVCFLSALESEENQFAVDDDDDSIVFCDSPLMMLSNNNLSDGGDVVWLSIKPVHIIEFHHQRLFHIVEEEEEEDTKQLYDANNNNKKKKKKRDEFSVVSVSSKGNGFIMEQNHHYHHHQCEDNTKQNRDKLLLSVLDHHHHHDCEWDARKFLFYYQDEVFNRVAVFAVPMKATAPVLMLNLCKKPVFWVQRMMKKLSIIALLVVIAASLILIFSFNDFHFIDENENGKKINDNCSHNIEVREVEKPITISPQMDSLLRSISKEEASEEEAMNLTVKTAKEKKRRRNKNKNKKKKGVINNGVLLLTDVSSSHSGNSTPNSPMSPEPIQAVTKPVLSHSATFPVSGVKSVMRIETSSLALNVRAPGSKPMKPRTEEKEKEKEYDIWGDHHLTGLNLMDRFKEVRDGKSFGFGVGEEEEECESFFVKGPQNYLGDSSVRFVSFCNQLG